MRMRTRAKQNTLPRLFAELNALHPLRPIQDRLDFENAQDISDKLAVLDRRSKDQDDYLETLSTLMAKYEDEHSPIQTEDLGPVETLKYLMESHDMNASDLGRILGNRALGAAILRGDRQLSKANIIELSRHFGVGASIFLKA